MNSTESENEIENAQPIVIKIDRRTIKRAPWRTTVNEDGTVIYNHKPLDPEYFKKYWHAKRKLIANLKFECEYCHQLTMRRHYERHQQRKSCIEAKNKLMESLVQ